MAKSETWRPVRASRISFDLKDPPTHDRAIEEIAKSVAEAQGNVLHAAAFLEVSYRQVSRWIAEYPDLKARVDAIREEFGHIHGVRNEDD